MIQDHPAALGNGQHMKPRITVVTIGVDDLEKSLRFYRDGLGFSTEGIIGKKFPLGASSPTEFTLGHNVSSKSEVDAVMRQARNAGAVIVKPAQDTFWGGYAGYFQDPDGHLWEVVWNPQWSTPA